MCWQKMGSEVTKTKVLALLWPLEMPQVAADADDSVLLRHSSAHGITSSHGFTWYINASMQL